MIHLYNALLCIDVHPKRFTIMCVGGGGVSPQPTPVCSIHLDDATAFTGQRRQCAHHTPATGGEEKQVQNKCSLRYSPVIVFYQFCTKHYCTKSVILKYQIHKPF